MWNPFKRSIGWCSFCGKRYSEVGPLIAGPNQIYICYSCAKTCVKKFEAGPEGVQPERRPPPWPDDARTGIRELVREIEDLSRTRVDPRAYYYGFLQRVVAAMAAIGGAVWTFDDEGHLSLSSQHNLGETGLIEKPEDRQRHGKLLRKIVDDGEDALVQPQYSSEADDVANPTDLLLVCGILKTGQKARGLVEIFQRTGSRAAVQRGYLQFVKQMCELASDYQAGLSG
jgi:hypothetical protein